METRLDFSFERFEMLANATGNDATQLAIDAIEIRKDDQARGKGEHADGVEKRRHRLGESQVAAKQALAALHLAGIGFVIVAHQMQDAVKDQDAHFGFECAAEARGIRASDGRSDGDVAEILIFARARSGFGPLG